MKYNIVYIGPVYSFWRKVAKHNWLAVTYHDMYVIIFNYEVNMTSHSQKY